MKHKKLFGLLMFAVLAITLASSVMALPLSIDEVEVDGTDLDQNQENHLSIERGQEFDVRVEFTATADHDNIVLQAFIAGYEHETISDTEGPFEVEGNTTYVKELELSLPEDVDEDHYRLRVMFTDRDSDEVIQHYSIKIDKDRHKLAVTEVMLRPEGQITAGSALLASVRVENFGEKDEDDVRVEVSVPKLGLMDRAYIEEIDSEEQEETEELFLPIPMEAQEGVYEVKVTVDYNDGRDQTTATRTINVKADPAFKAAQQPKTRLAVSSTLEHVKAGDNIIYPLTVTNAGRTDQAYTVAISGAGDWADVTVSPSNTQIVKAGQSKAFYLNLDVDKDASEGDHVFTATISSDGETLEEIAFTANVKEADKSFAGFLGKALVVVLVVALIVLIVVGLVAAFNRMGDEEYRNEPKTYY